MTHRWRPVRRQVCGWQSPSLLRIVARRAPIRRAGRVAHGLGQATGQRPVCPDGGVGRDIVAHAQPCALSTSSLTTHQKPRFAWLVPHRSVAVPRGRQFPGPQQPDCRHGEDTIPQRAGCGKRVAQESGSWAARALAATVHRPRYAAAPGATFAPGAAVTTTKTRIGPWLNLPATLSVDAAAQPSAQTTVPPLTRRSPPGGRGSSSPESPLRWRPPEGGSRGYRLGR